MYFVKDKERNKIEFVLSGAVCASEFRGIINHIESLSSHQDRFSVIFDARELRDRYTFKIFLDEYDSLRENKLPLRRIAFVSDDESEIFSLNQFGGNVEPEFRTFDNVEKAQEWITVTRKEFFL